MQRVGLIAPGRQGGAGVTVVELGAGKGYLGGTLADCCGVDRLVATDIKAGLKLKADRHLRHIVFGRHRVDLKDYVPAATPEVAAAAPGSPWVAVAKHLCGAATDYGLRACMLPYDAKRARGGGAAANGAAGRGGGGWEADGGCGGIGGVEGSAVKRPRLGASAEAAVSSRGGEEEADPSAAIAGGGVDGDATRINCSSVNGGAGQANGEGGSGAGGGDGGGGDGGGGAVLRGLAIAPCCHHRCGWRAYVGKPLFRRLGLSPWDFELISWMTGWALCGHDAPAGSEAEANPDRQDEDSDGADGVNGDEAHGSSAASGQAAAAAGTGAGADADADAVAAVANDASTGGGGAEQSGGGKAQLARGQQQEAALDEECGRHEPASYKPDLPLPYTSFDPAARLSRPRRMAIGQACKQLIDAGRLGWLRRRFRSAELVSYIGPEVTGENRLLLAVQPLSPAAAAGGSAGGYGGVDTGGVDGGEVIGER